MLHFAALNPRRPSCASSGGLHSQAEDDIATRAVQAPDLLVSALPATALVVERPHRLLVGARAEGARVMEAPGSETHGHREAPRPLSPLAIPRSHVVGTLDTWTSNVGTWIFRTFPHDDVTGGLSRGVFVRRSSAGVWKASMMPRNAGNSGRILRRSVSRRPRAPISLRAGFPPPILSLRYASNSTNRPRTSGMNLDSEAGSQLSMKSA